MTVRDQERFDFIYRKYYKKLLRTAVNMLQNVPAAEDLTNETFTILLTRFDRMQQHPNIGGWLYTVLSNLALNEIKNGIGAFSCRMKHYSKLEINQISFPLRISYPPAYLIQIKKYCVYATYKI